MALRTAYLNLRRSAADMSRQPFLPELQMGPCTVVDFQAFKLVQQTEEESKAEKESEVSRWRAPGHPKNATEH
eukprot:scaffold731_cov261-Pinguiococcus_pyrenoidosus.AAC.88